MGLRARNAERTRDMITETALTLFLEQGYDHTTMEQVAERTEIGTTTLYRYFPTKDLLVLEPLALSGHLAAALHERPSDEPLDRALGQALAAFITTPRADAARLRQVRAVIEATPGLQTRLLEEFTKERTLLEQAVAERMGRPADDLFCVMSARMTTTVLEVVSGRGAADPDDDPRKAAREALSLARTVMDQVRLEPPALPTLSE